MSAVESAGRPPLSVNGAVAHGNGAAGMHGWESTAPTVSPRVDAPIAPTPTCHGAAVTGGAVAQPMRSPMVKVHQPYRGIPLSVFGVESELEGYAGINRENLVPVKPVYKSLASYAAPGQAPRGSSSLPNRSSQRSPITAFDGGEGQVTNSCSSDGPSAALHQNATGGVGSLVAAAAAARAASNCMYSNNSNKYVVSLNQPGDYADGAGVGGFNGFEANYCPVAFQMVISEERHLNYSGVELDQSELNSGDTVEKARRLQQRRRQVQYGKETTGYSNYVSAVPCRCDREFRNPMHPMTPRPEYDCSKRTFDRYLNIWRRQLHLWDDYNPKNLEPQYTRIGIPTLKRLGLEPVQSTPEGHRGALLSFTPTTGQGVMGVSSARTACTPIVLRQARRESSLPVASASTQRPTAHQSSGHATVACSHCPITAMPHIRPSSSCGCGSWSITNTPHTPYYGSTNSNSSYPPPLLSVLAQPTIYSPHWADSSRQSSPNPITGQRGCGYPFHYAPGGCQVATSGPPGGGGPWESCNCYMNGNCNNYAALGYVSPYGGPRGTPHSPPNQYHHSHYGGLGSSSMPAPSPMCVGQEGWGSASRQMHQ